MTVAAAPVDAGRLAQSGRRRRRGASGANGARTGSADERRPSAGDSIPDPGRATADDLALAGNGNDEDDDPAPSNRARNVPAETGPMLPEQDDRPSHTELDLGAPGSGPQGLAPSDISRGMEPLLGRLTNCAAAGGDGATPHDRVTVQLRIRSTGAPSAARVSAAGADARFVTCVRRVVASAHFPAFHGPDAISASWGFDVD